MFSQKEILDHFLDDLGITQIYQQDPSIIYSKMFPQTLSQLDFVMAMYDLMVWAKQAHNFIGLSDEPSIEEVVDLVYQNQN